MTRRCIQTTIRVAAPRYRATAWMAVASLFSVIAVGTLSASAGATGILPPGNPPANIAPSNGDWLTSIDSASAAEGVGAMKVNESEVEALPVAEQLFIVINEERIDRGLAPIQYMTAQLNSYALQGANADTDPSFPTALTGGAPLSGGASIWAGGTTSVFEADYYWMYTDGWGGSAESTSNAGCTSASSSGCWEHRDIVLYRFSSCAGGAAPVLSMGAAYGTTGAGGSLAAIMVSTCGAPPSDVTLSWSQITTLATVQQKVVGIAALPSGLGYWAASSDGAVSAFGSAANLGSMAGQSLNSPIVAIAATPDGGGYWLVGADGGIFSFGDARFYGSTGALRLNQPIVGITSTPDGGGYWLVAADGGIFSFGDAKFYGSTGALRLNQPIVGMSVDPATGGYWLVAADGGIFSFNAPFLGSTGDMHLNQPIVGMSADPATGGYRLVASDGGIFSFDASFLGSTGGIRLNQPIHGMAATSNGQGYWLVAADGGIFTFGNATFYGSPA